MCVWSICRWITSSRRPRTWTTWRSCMKAGRRGCERGFPRRFTSVPARVRNPPESTGSGASEPQSCMRANKRGFGWGHRGPPVHPHGTSLPPVAQQQIQLTPTTRFSGLHPSPRKRARGGNTEDRGGGCGGEKEEEEEDDEALPTFNNPLPPNQPLLHQR